MAPPYQQYTTCGILLIYVASVTFALISKHQNYTWLSMEIIFMLVFVIKGNFITTFLPSKKRKILIQPSPVLRILLPLMIEMVHF